ncbi:hypothetical protein [Qipengyuania gelatinilytica]|uniref:LPXTG cell wall anchor domain-containing protein n=1 Tax=Qipengyuania gelatinilytica TaxID=2867231 RepID=A0ABX9A477_9SPHN|nr:hypothetical protein [Qipengyuania gelatinilytica]QZD96065.1 hypothetical protein K3136_04990 [Qipengyuania gelatinilytica]
MPKRIRLPLAALLLAAPTALSAQSTRDFQLPPAPTPTASPQVQGPVDSEGSTVPARPRVIPTATPTPTPVPTATANPAATVQPLPTPTPTPSASVPAATTPRTATPTAAPTSRPTTVPVQPPASMPESDAVLPDTGLEQAPPQRDLPAQAADAAPQAQAETGASEQPEWLWPAVGGGILALLGLGYLVSRRRKNAEPPQIERPVVAASGAGTVGAADLQLRAEAIKLTRSVMNATLHYRVTLLNRSGNALSNVALGADVVSAHGGVPVEQQVASSSQLLEKRHTFDRIAPGQSVRYEGTVMIPLSQARIIRQGNAALFVPLLRVRIDGADEEVLVKTFVIGQGVPDGGRVSPFRLDDGPRSYEPIAARALD